MTIRSRSSIVVVLLLLAACSGEEHQNLKQWMLESSKNMRGKVQPIPEIKPFPIVSYDAGDLIDPFSPEKAVPEKGKGTGGLQPDFDRPREPLEAYPLESLKMVGVVRGKDGLHALVQVDGMVHQVKVGNHLGQDFGVVTSISESEVGIKELVQDPTGQTADWVERQSSLQLQEGSESQKETRK